MSTQTTERELEILAARRWKVAVILTAIMVTAYFGFILLIAFDKPLMGKLVFGGSVSVGVLVGACVILLAPVLTSFYVRWTNTHYDHAVASISDRNDAHAAAAAGLAAAAKASLPDVSGLARARTPMPVAPEGAAPSASSPNSPSSARPEVRS